MIVLINMIWRHNNQNNETNIKITVWTGERANHKHRSEDCPYNLLNKVETAKALGF
jgi:hypothetical protein